MTNSSSFSKERAEKQLRLMSRILIYCTIVIVIATPVIIIIDNVSGMEGSLAEVFFVFVIIFGFVLLSSVFIWLFILYRRARKAMHGD